MEIVQRKSEIVDFYKDKNILITGASGFLGRLLVEKLLRQCNVKKVYILLRTKKGANPHDRVNSLFQVPLFDNLRASKPNFLDFIEVVEGDVSLPDLGLKESTKALLVEKIQIVFHGAATVNFEEPLKRAAAINVRGSKDVALLCREMQNLQAFVHVSTAFCHCPRKEIGEMFYQTPLTADNLIKLADCLSEEQLNNVSKTLMEDWPNTYAFTKAVAEDAIKNYALGLPACVFRPAIVISTLSDPIVGWIDNLYGPSGIVAGCAAGLIRVARVDGNARADFVPADLVTNGLMAAAYKTYLLGPNTDIPIFNFTTAKENPLTYDMFYKMIRHQGSLMPPVQAVWYITLTGIKSKFWYTILSFLFHTLPAFVIDLVLVALRKQPQALKIYRKVHKFADVLAYFSTQSWNFQNHNTQALLCGLNKTDRELFDFDMSKLNWDQMIEANARGMRKYIMKEDESNIPVGKRKMFWLHVVHRCFQAVLLILFFWINSQFLKAVPQAIFRL